MIDRKAGGLPLRDDGFTQISTRLIQQQPDLSPLVTVGT